METNKEETTNRSEKCIAQSYKWGDRAKKYY